LIKKTEKKQYMEVEKKKKLEYLKKLYNEVLTKEAVFKKSTEIS